MTSTLRLTLGERCAQEGARGHEGYQGNPEETALGCESSSRERIFQDRSLLYSLVHNSRREDRKQRQLIDFGDSAIPSPLATPHSLESTT